MVNTQEETRIWGGGGEKGGVLQTVGPPIFFGFLVSQKIIANKKGRETENKFGEKLRFDGHKMATRWPQNGHRMATSCPRTPRHIIIPQHPSTPHPLAASSLLLLLVSAGIYDNNISRV